MSDMDITTIVENVNNGMVSPAIYCDDEIFRLERERLFGRSWMYLAHESEIPEPGDYVLRRIVDDSFIVLVNAHREPVDVALPARRFGTHWTLELSSALPEGLGTTYGAREPVRVEGCALVLLRRL